MTRQEELLLQSFQLDLHLRPTGELHVLSPRRTVQCLLLLVGSLFFEKRVLVVVGNASVYQLRHEWS